VAEELAATVVEFADHRRAQDTFGTVGVIQAPLVSLRIVKAKAEKIDVSGATVGLEFDQLRAAVPDLPDHCPALVLHPAL
jgi:hypothetical protein